MLPDFPNAWSWKFKKTSIFQSYFQCFPALTFFVSWSDPDMGLKKNYDLAWLALDIRVKSSQGHICFTIMRWITGGHGSKIQGNWYIFDFWLLMAVGCVTLDWIKIVVLNEIKITANYNYQHRMQQKIKLLENVSSMNYFYRIIF
jgi:hypothetical protein